jgi:hypothetical protein
MVKYLSFHNSSFALRYLMARPQCDTPLVPWLGLAWLGLLFMMLRSSSSLCFPHCKNKQTTNTNRDLHGFAKHEVQEELTKAGMAPHKLNDA